MRVQAIVIAAMLAGFACGAAADAAPVNLVLSELFVSPVGPRGLEPTTNALQLNGHRVSITGYMVREEEPAPGHFMLAPVPTSLAEVADGPADYLPGATVFVELPARHAAQNIAFRPGLWRLVGTLALGAHDEPNGRVAYVRILLDDIGSIAAPDATQPVLFTSNVTIYDERRMAH